MKKAGKILVSMFAAVAGSTFATSFAGYQIFAKVMKRGRKIPFVGSHVTGENPLQEMYEAGRQWAVAKKESCERLVIESEGTELVGYFYQKPDTTQTVVLVHGLNSSYLGRLSSAAYYEQKGYQVLSVECRGHGESGGVYRTLGYWDSQDLIAWVNYLVEQKGQKKILLDGVSMGAASVLSAVGDEKLPEEVCGAIADCSFTNIYEIFKFHMKRKLHVPVVPILSSVELFCNKLAHVSMIARSPIESVKRAKVPILLIHGVDDDTVPYEMGQELYEACTSKKQMFSAKGAGHGDSCRVDPEGYRQAVEGFLDSLQ